jgi:hypothetical protein
MLAPWPAEVDAVDFVRLRCGAATTSISTLFEFAESCVEVADADVMSTVVPDGNAESSVTRNVTVTDPPAGMSPTFHVTVFPLSVQAGVQLPD